jgi:putative molybdopterin biosynthesis protein
VVRHSSHQKERYDLVVRQEQIDTPEVATMLRILRSEKFQNELKSIGGYDVRDIGKVMAET